MTRGQALYVILSGLFIAFLVLAELTASKLFEVDLGFASYLMTMGVIPFPITFLITDLLNEYFGRRGVRFTTLLGMAAVTLIYTVLAIDLRIPASAKSPVSDAAFQTVFANTRAIIVGSLVAYLLGQLIDIQVFHWLRKRTANRHIWLRATGSTIVSQLLDSFVVIYVAFGSGIAPAPVWSGAQVVEVSLTNWTYKVLIALALTPVVYAGHHWMQRWLGREGEELRQAALADRAFVITPWPG